MTVDDYIASGVLEIYAVGGLLPAEHAAAEKMIRKHPKIKAELFRIESALLAYAAAHVSQPPQHLKTEILNQINSQSA